MIKSRKKYLQIAIFFIIIIGNGFCLLANPIHIWRITPNRKYQAASQNWSVAQDAHGVMYFANNIGLLEFDGITWTLYPAPNGSIIRAVAVDVENRIFTAGYREASIGNEMRWDGWNIILNQEVENNFTTNEEFWNVVILKQSGLFSVVFKIYIYNYQNFKLIQPEGFVNSIFWWRRPHFCKSDE